ncbi:MAG: TetR/AcrR family transcriptional regulator [Pseudomonadota bacterium]
MVGTRKFDETALADQLVRAFWKHGYRTATLTTLAQATGVLRGSLYNAYRSKERLMLMALERYSIEQRGPVIEALARPDIREAIEGYFDAHVARMANDKNPTGCLICQTTLECGEADGPINDHIRAHHKRSEAALTERFERAITEGDLVSNYEANELAIYFLGVSRGMAVIHRAYGDIDPVRTMARAAMETLNRTE